MSLGASGLVGDGTQGGGLVGGGPFSGAAPTLALRTPRSILFHVRPTTPAAATRRAMPPRWLQFFILRAARQPAATPDIRAAIYASLSSDATVRSLVGGRIYPAAMPESAAYPCLVYSVTSNDRLTNLSGLAGLATPRVTIELRTYRVADAVTLRDLLKAKWGGFRGTLGGLEVTTAFPLGEFDQDLDPSDASDRRPYRVAFDWRFHYRENIPSPPTG